MHAGTTCFHITSAPGKWKLGRNLFSMLPLGCKDENCYKYLDSSEAFDA